MNVMDLKDNWETIKGKMKQKFGILIDSDLVLVEGKHDEMLSKLELKLGNTKEELLKIMNGFNESPMPIQ